MTAPPAPTPGPRTVDSLAELRSLVGVEVGVSQWLAVTQERVDLFAEATRDHQWIHVDAVRAKEGPYGGTIAHGFLTLSLLPSFGTEILTIGFGSARINYGLESVRFPAPVPVGSRVRGRATVQSVEELPKGVQLKTGYVVQVEDRDRPACVATQITLIVP